MSVTDENWKNYNANRQSIIDRGYSSIVDILESLDQNEPYTVINLMADVANGTDEQLREFIEAYNNREVI